MIFQRWHPKLDLNNPKTLIRVTDGWDPRFKGPHTPEREETKEGIGRRELTDSVVTGGSKGINVLISLPCIDRW
jgi:hypothetical protein